MIFSLTSALLLVSRIVYALDPRLSQHMLNVALIGEKLAQKQKLSPQQIHVIFLSGFFHDIGFLVDNRRIKSLDELDSFSDPHQQKSAEMLKGVKVLEDIIPVIRQHHFDEQGKGTKEQHTVYFADTLERMLFNNYQYPPQHIIEDFRKKCLPIDENLCEIVCELLHDPFLLSHLDCNDIQKGQRLLEIISPVHDVELGISGLKDICLLLAKIIDTYSGFTSAHSIMVGEIAHEIAAKMNLSEEECQKIQIAGYLHDVGKVFIPLSILEKQGRLSTSEMQVMKNHSYLSGEIIRDCTLLDEIMKIACLHHERLDGSGYPFGLKGDHLGLPERIIAVADVFTALIEERPYRPSMPYTKALAILEESVVNGGVDKEVFDTLSLHAEYLSTLQRSRLF